MSSSISSFTWEQHPASPVPLFVYKSNNYSQFNPPNPRELRSIGDPRPTSWPVQRLRPRPHPSHRHRHRARVRHDARRGQRRRRPLPARRPLPGVQQQLPAEPLGERRPLAQWLSEYTPIPHRRPICVHVYPRARSANTRALKSTGGTASTSSPGAGTWPSSTRSAHATMRRASTCGSERRTARRRQAFARRRVSPHASASAGAPPLSLLTEPTPTQRRAAHLIEMFPVPGTPKT